VVERDPSSDEALLDRLQRAAFGYFLEAFNPVNGLIADRSRAGSPASIAVVGFALASYPVAVERGWMSRSEAAARTLASLRFFWSSPQSDSPDATGYKGFYYHFLDMQTGRRVWQSELSPVDTTFLLAGMLTADAYFTGDTPQEIEIHELADYGCLMFTYVTFNVDLLPHADLVVSSGAHLRRLRICCRRLLRRNVKCSFVAVPVENGNNEPNRMAILLECFKIACYFVILPFWEVARPWRWGTRLSIERKRP